MRILGFFNRAGANKAPEVTRQFVKVVRMPHGAAVKTGEVWGAPNADKTYKVCEVAFPWKERQLVVCTEIGQDGGLYNPEYTNIPERYNMLSKLQKVAERIEEKSKYRFIEITPQTRYSDLKRFNADPNTFFWRRIVKENGVVEYVVGTEIGQDGWVGGIRTYKRASKNIAKLFQQAVKEILKKL